VSKSDGNSLSRMLARVNLGARSLMHKDCSGRFMTAGLRLAGQAGGSPASSSMAPRISAIILSWLSR
jgi:hypothetical protein